MMAPKKAYDLCADALLSVQLAKKEEGTRRIDLNHAEEALIQLRNLLAPPSARTAHAVAGEEVNHPPHYGGADHPYEAIKVIEAWGLGFCLGNTVKYIARAGKKGIALVDLRKAAWYLNREIENLADENTGGIR